MSDNEQAVINAMQSVIENAEVHKPKRSKKTPPAPYEPLLKPVSVADVLTNPAKPPAFAWDGYLPHGEVSLFGAHGGTGKSTVALMLAVAVATGRPLFGVPTVPAPAIFVSLEDGTGVVRHRLSGICRAWGVDPRTLANLHVVDGSENPELFTADTKGAGEVTTAYTELVKLAQTARPGLIVIDNASDAYGGDEINRRQVRGFLRTLKQVASGIDCAVVLLAHVNKNTSSGAAQNTEGYSGSTAWHNTVRSRLFMAREKDGLLKLEHQKVNVGKLRDPLRLVWPDDGLPMLAGDVPDFDVINARSQGRADDVAAAGLLALLAEFEGRRQFCHTGTTSRCNPYAVLASEPAFKRMELSKEDVKRIVTQCDRAGWIAPLDYKTPDRKTHQRWTVTEKGREFAGLLPALVPTVPTVPTSEDGT